jgi:pimeloyl-ACP methyl ester carboxylesterase
MDWFPGPKGWESPVMFLLHGVMSVSDVGYRLWAKKLNALGWGAIFFHLPYHYGRKPQGALSGELALTANLIRTAEGIRQAVVELRLMSRLLREKGCPHIGLWGTSYGGWIASLLASLEDNISTAWLLEPIVDVDVAIWESPATRVIRRQLATRGITRELVKQHVAKSCASYHRPRVKPEHLILVAGTFDKIAPPKTIRALHEKWQGSHYAEFRQGHVGYQLMPETLKLAREKLPHLFER